MPDKQPDNITLYYDHYMDTFEQIRGYLSKRDKHSIVLIVLLAVVSFFSVDPSKFSNYVSQYLNSQYGVKEVSFELLNTILLFALLFTTYKYYQICICIERSYKYLHNVENNLSVMTGLNIDRESADYLNNYPAISSITHIFYVYVIPNFIITISVFKIIGEFKLLRGINLAIDLILVVAITISSIVYLLDRLLLSKGIGWKDIWQPKSEELQNPEIEK